MLRTYKAILHGNTLDWVSEKPVLTDEGKEVHVTVLEGQKTRLQSDGQAMAAALKLISDSGKVSSFGDALEWQREVREDRPLPGREND